ncbi:MAG: radical SAM protein [Verrucomicrobiota bacterium]
MVSRGCPGGCTFCGLGFHQGKFLSSRSIESVLKEIRKLTESGTFRGTISDLGGPTANLYAARNGHAPECEKCHRPSCLWPSICPVFEVNEQPGIDLLQQARTQPGVKHVFVQSGIRMDVALRTPDYLRELVQNHVSGHMKVAPEHMHPEVLRRMRKPAGDFPAFMEKFFELSEEAGKEQYLVPYFISSFPGCTEKEMGAVETFLKKEKWNLQQVQDFIPLPMTGSAAMYVTGLDINTGQPIPVVKNAGDRERQKRMLRPNSAHEARACGSRGAGPQLDTVD